MELLDITVSEPTAINSALHSFTGKKIKDFTNAEGKLKKVKEKVLKENILGENSVR